MANPLDLVNKANEFMKKGEKAVDTPNQILREGEKLKKQGEGIVTQGQKTADQLKELSGQQLTIKIGAASKEAAALEGRLEAHGFEIAKKDGKIDAREAIRLEEFAKTKPGLQGEVKFDEKKNTLVFSKKALETLKADPAAAKAPAAPAAAPAPQAAPAPVAQQPTPAAKAPEPSAMDDAKAKAKAAIEDGKCVLPWTNEYKTEHCANVRKNTKTTDENRVIN